MRFTFSDDPSEMIMDDLRRAGWSLGDARFGDTWTVSGTNGENVILARVGTIEEAWRRGGTGPDVRNGPTFERTSVSQLTPRLTSVGGS